MSLNLLQKRIIDIQLEYKDLLCELLPVLKSGYSHQALDEINVFWHRRVDIVRLYLTSYFSDNDSYAFTASTFMDYDDGEHLPFLLIGDLHVLDDPLCAYSRICANMPEEKISKPLYEQIIKTAEDNVKIIENCDKCITILPLRILSQTESHEEILNLGEKIFFGLFNGIDNFEEYFDKCKSIDDIVKYARKDIHKIIAFSETDTESEDFKERFQKAVLENKKLIDISSSDANKFLMLVYGYIQQAVDIIVTCVAYKCFPYIRYPLALRYVTLIAQNLSENQFIEIMLYKMSVAFVLYNLSDKERLNVLSTKEYVNKIKEYDFNSKLLETFETHGINYTNFTKFSVTQLVIDELEKLYLFLVK